MYCIHFLITLVHDKIEDSIMNTECSGFGRASCIIPTFLWTWSKPNKTV